MPEKHPFFQTILFFISTSIFLLLYNNAYSWSRENTTGISPDTLDGKGTPISVAYRDVFNAFGDNAWRFYNDYGPFALEFLKEYRVEGLALLEKYGKELADLSHLLNHEDIFRLYNKSDTAIQNLRIFSPKALAWFYRDFGEEGIQHISYNPENFFLISNNKATGMELIKLAGEKGDIVFPIAKKHGLAFAKLYDNTVLDIVVKFGEDGVTALKDYGEKAKVIFSIFIDDEIFYHVIKTYGYKQTIPVIYLFYENKDFTSRVWNYIKDTGTYEWISGWWYGTDAFFIDFQSEEMTKYRNARRAVNLIFELGNDFLDRFEILDINNVREEAVTIITNKLRNFLVSDMEKVSRKMIRHEDIPFHNKIFAGLDLLGIIPVGTAFSKGTKLAVRGFRSARSTQGFRGLAHMTDGLVSKYGNDAVPFVAKYGDDGIKALKVTNGNALKLSQIYGDDVVRYISRYGKDAVNVIERYGKDVIVLAQQYGENVIKYIAQYGDTGLSVIRKHGKDIVLLSSAYGNEVIRLTALYGGEVLPYICKYGSNGIKVIEKHGNDILRLSKKHGDEVIKYTIMYDDSGYKLARKGRAGIFIMRFMPHKALYKGVRFAKYGLAASVMFMLFTHPVDFFSGLVKSLAWLFNTSPVIIALIMGSFATFLLLRYLRPFLKVFQSFARIKGRTNKTLK